MIRFETTVYWFPMGPMAAGASPEIPCLVRSDQHCLQVQYLLCRKLQKQHLSACVLFSSLTPRPGKKHSLSQSKVYVCLIMLVYIRIKHIKKTLLPIGCPFHSIPSGHLGSRSGCNGDNLSRCCLYLLT